MQKVAAYYWADRIRQQYRALRVPADVRVEPGKDWWYLDIAVMGVQEIIHTSEGARTRVAALEKLIP